MGIKEEMEGDLADSVGKGPKVSVRKKTVETDPTKHEHGSGICDQAYFDDEGRRRITRVQGRIPKYQANCKACQAEDKKRAEAQPPEHDFDSTVFLIPEYSPDSDLAKLYLSKRYPGVELAALPTIRPNRLAVRKGCSVVVVTRRPQPGQHHFGPSRRLIEDKRGEMVETPVPLEEHLAEIHESAPLSVDDCVTTTAATMFSDASVDLAELASQLSDLAAPSYRIEQYTRVPGSDEVVFTMRRVG